MAGHDGREERGGGLEPRLDRLALLVTGGESDQFTRRGNNNDISTFEELWRVLGWVRYYEPAEWPM